MRIYIVQKGDTLQSIAEENGISLDALKRFNPNMLSSELIFPGMKVRIPARRKNAQTIRQTQKNETKRVQLFARSNERPLGMLEEMLELEERDTQLKDFASFKASNNIDEKNRAIKYSDSMHRDIERKNGGTQELPAFVNSKKTIVDVTKEKNNVTNENSRQAYIYHVNVNQTIKSTDMNKNTTKPAMFTKQKNTDKQYVYAINEKQNQQSRKKAIPTINIPEPSMSTQTYRCPYCNQYTNMSPSPQTKPNYHEHRTKPRWDKSSHMENKTKTFQAPKQQTLKTTATTSAKNAIKNKSHQSQYKYPEK